MKKFSLKKVLTSPKLIGSLFLKTKLFIGLTLDLKRSFVAKEFDQTFF
jgi:hypothetical protein